MEQKGLRTGISFGLTSGVITTLGLVVGLHSGTHSTLAVTGGIFTIAVADAMSDALGIHISREADPDSGTHEVWTATAATFLAKFLMALTFVLPVMLLDLATAIVVSLVWGLGVVAALSYRMAKQQGVRILPVVVEHLTIALLVVLVTHFVGEWVAATFPE